MNISRKWFIGGAASFAMMQGCKVFTDSSGLFGGCRANVKFGVISDVHVIASNTDRGYCGNTRTLEHTLEWFDSEGVDAVMVAGDIADTGLVSEFQVFADAWYKIFPNDRSRMDGRKVERLFIYGNHDWEGYKYGYSVFGRQSAELKDDWMSDFGMRKTWERIFDEEYKPVYLKNIKGYDFIGAHWDGDAGARWDGMHGIVPWFEKNASRLDPERPFFYFQHPHPKDTCYGSWAWGRDNGVSTKILAGHPNAVAFSGHSHYSLVDERCIWQGAFTSLGTGSLRYASHEAGEFEGGYENSGGGTKSRPDGAKTMTAERVTNARSGMLVSVYDDRTIFRRRDFYHDADLGPAWVLPHLCAETRPFGFVERAVKSKAPQFSDGAKVEASLGKVLTRAAKKSLSAKASKEDIENAKQPAFNVSFPAVERREKTIVWRYDVAAELENGNIAMLKRVLSSDFHRPFPAAPKKYLLGFLLSDLPKDAKIRFSVTPYDCFGNAGMPIKTEFLGG